MKGSDRQAAGAAKRIERRFYPIRENPAMQPSLMSERVRPAGLARRGVKAL